MAQPPSGRSASQASYEFWNHPDARVAQAVRVRTDRNPTRDDLDTVFRGSPAVPAGQGAVRGTKQYRAAVAGRQVRALPTARQRAMKRRVGKVQKAGDAFLRSMGVLFLAIFVAALVTAIIKTV